VADERPRPGIRLRHRITGRVGAVLEVRVQTGFDFQVKVKPETALPTRWVQTGVDQGTVAVWWDFGLTEVIADDSD
jgi:hypothetical protein